MTPRSTHKYNKAGNKKYEEMMSSPLATPVFTSSGSFVGPESKVSMPYLAIPNSPGAFLQRQIQLQAAQSQEQLTASSTDLQRQHLQQLQQQQQQQILQIQAMQLQALQQQAQLPQSQMQQPSSQQPQTQMQTKQTPSGSDASEVVRFRKRPNLSVVIPEGNTRQVVTRLQTPHQDAPPQGITVPVTVPLTPGVEQPSSGSAALNHLGGLMTPLSGISTPLSAQLPPSLPTNTPSGSANAQVFALAQQQLQSPSQPSLAFGLPSTLTTATQMQQTSEALMGISSPRLTGPLPSPGGVLPLELTTFGDTLNTPNLLTGLAWPWASPRSAAIPNPFGDGLSTPTSAPLPGALDEALGIPSSPRGELPRLVIPVPHSPRQPPPSRSRESEGQQQQQQQQQQQPHPPQQLQQQEQEQRQTAVESEGSDRAEKRRRLDEVPADVPVVSAAAT
jgi:hypothetical protein